MMLNGEQYKQTIFSAVKSAKKARDFRPLLQGIEVESGTNFVRKQISRGNPFFIQHILSSSFLSSPIEAVMTLRRFNSLETDFIEIKMITGESFKQSPVLPVDKTGCKKGFNYDSAYIDGQGIIEIELSRALLQSEKLTFCLHGYRLKEIKK